MPFWATWIGRVATPTSPALRRRFQHLAMPVEPERQSKSAQRGPLKFDVEQGPVLTNSVDEDPLRPHVALGPLECVHARQIGDVGSAVRRHLHDRYVDRGTSVLGSG